MPDEIADPHTLVFDTNDDIWFTAQHSNAIARLDVDTGDVSYVKALSPRSRPYGIKIDQQNRPWAVLVGTNKLATVDPLTFTISEITLPRKDARPRRLEITDNGDIWYVDYAEGFLGQYNPNSKTFNEWPMPGGSISYPYGTALDSKQRIWIAETGSTPNTLVGFDTQSKKFLGSTLVKSGGNIRHMYFDKPGNAIWFGVDTGAIGRASLKN
jgi:virginiamycin B lyase